MADFTAVVPVLIPGRPTLLFVANVEWFVYSHFMGILKSAREHGFCVHVAAGLEGGVHAERIRQAGFEFHELPLRRGLGGIWPEVRAIAALYGLYRKLRPAIIHHVGVKPLTYGTLMARVAGVPAIVNTVTGLGYVLASESRKASILRYVLKAVYRRLLASGRIRLIFENPDDKELFTRERLVSESRAVVIRGAGIDVEAYECKDETNAESVIVLPARVLRDKGVYEFAQAAQLVRAKGIKARFALVGALDGENPAGLKEAEVATLCRTFGVEWWGHCGDMKALYERVLIICLPSYREGLPRVLLEAAASGRAIVASDVPGCREVVINNETGLLVPAKDSVALSVAIEKLLSEPEFRRRLSAEARRHVEQGFSLRLVTTATAGVYRALLASHL